MTVKFRVTIHWKDKWSTTLDRILDGKGELIDYLWLIHYDKLAKIHTIEIEVLSE